MALKSTVFKADLQVSDMDRHYYQSHALTIAQHPSETDDRMMVRVLAFALNADEALVFGKGISSDDEPDLWRKELTGEVDLWIEIGQPDEQRIRRAAGRAKRVIVYSYSGRSAEVWWKKTAAAVARTKNVSVIDIAPATVEALAALTQRTMQIQFMVQDGQAQVISGDAIVPIELTTLA
ncbi:YaeQ family protein [Luteibacter flocculans]|uniref:YaeQ family protein n=1 Tax=Luteibacter flocculans TaxID=2780091 RepID=A0ABY4SXY9_9GAMM|nr:YaeQ family protein [Luteibacter flocculans]URL57581.1 YaeQ family protein [Luteibacter flocculans]